MNIGVDIDGVVTDFVATFIQVVDEQYKYRLRVSDIREHDLYKVLGISKRDTIKLILETLSRDLKPQPGVVETLTALSESHKIFIITARPWRTRTLTRLWLKEHKVPYDKLVFLEEGSKHLLGKKLDLVIDDNLAEILQWVGKVPKIIVFDHPWNRSRNVKENFVRVRNWKDITRIVQDQNPARLLIKSQ